MNNVNFIVVSGTLTEDPELSKTATTGAHVANLTIAVNDSHKDRTGNMNKRLTFIDAIVFGPKAELCGQYLKKGSPVLVNGKVFLDRWETQHGTHRDKIRIRVDEVCFVDVKRVETNAGVQASANTQGNIISP